MSMHLLDLWEEADRLAIAAEESQADRLAGADVAAAARLGRVIADIAALDWDIRVAEEQLFRERDHCKQMTLLHGLRRELKARLAACRSVLVSAGGDVVKG